MNKELSKILIRKNFKNFWNCLEYLIIAGYPLMEAFSNSIKQFGSSNIFNRVAFIRIEEPQHNLLTLRATPRKCIAKIGIIGDDNIHLDGMYSTYRKMLIYKPYLHYDTDIEATCEIITIEALSELMLDYLSDTSLQHFGYDALKKVDTDRKTPTVTSPIEEYFGGIDNTGLMNELAIKLKIK